MQNNTISIVLATYNGADYIKEQFESLLNQTLPPKEIIVSDDQSSDATLDIIAELAARSSIDVRIIRRDPRLGFRDNFLLTAKEATGDFIAFCDQDDIWRKDKLARCAEYFTDPEVTVIVHRAETIDAASNPLGEFNQGITGTRAVPPLSYDPWGAFYGFSVTFRRTLLDLHPVEDRFVDYVSPKHRIAHDRWITFLGQTVGKTIEIDENLVAYRQHGANLYGKDKARLSTPREDLVERSAAYLAATTHMIDIVRGFDETTKQRFPLFDRDRALAFYKDALTQLKARDSVYCAESRVQSMSRAILAALLGHYKSVNNRRMRWKSLIRDLQFAATRE